MEVESSSATSSSSSSSSQTIAGTKRSRDVALSNETNNGSKNENINKNNNDTNENTSAISPTAVRPRLMENKNRDRSSKTQLKHVDRWRIHRQTEDYVNLVGDIMYPDTKFTPFGTDPVIHGYQLSRITALGYLLAPLRKPLIVEKWSPYEIAVFEAALTLYGKDFNRVQKFVKTKTVKEVIEFYYAWKKTGHYKQWKQTFIPDERGSTGAPVLSKEQKDKEAEIAAIMEEDIEDTGGDDKD